MTDVVSYRVENGVAWLTIERPEARNALNAAVRAGLFTGARRFNDDDTAKLPTPPSGASPPAAPPVSAWTSPGASPRPPAGR